MVKSVSAAFHALPAEDQAKVAIIASDHGEAAALGCLRRSSVRPPSAAIINTGRRARAAMMVPVVLYVGGNVERCALCRSIEVMGTLGGPHVMPYENNRSIVLCRGSRRPS